jgi:hypothetical protein
MSAAQPRNTRRSKASGPFLLQVLSLLLMVWLENDLLNLHVVEDVISFHRLSHWHYLVRDKAVLHVSRRVLG